MLRLEQKTLADLGRPDYSFYAFRTNPFRVVPVAVQEPSFLTDRDPAFLELRRTIGVSLHDKKFAGRILSADFGMGKSHILKFLRHRINIDLRERAEGRAIAAYTVPGKSMLDLYTGIVENLDDEFLVEVSSAISRKYPNIQPEIGQGRQLALWSDIGGLSYYVPKYVNDLWQALPAHDRRQMEKDYFAALIFLQDANYRGEALYWLQGGKPSRTGLGAMGISSWITRDTAQSAFVTLISAIHLAGYEHFYLCLDEMEKLTYLSPRLQSEYFEQLRFVIDQLTEGFSIFGAVTPDAWQLLENAQHAFQSRLRQFRTIVLRPMNSEEVVELVRDYIHEERMAYVEGGEYPYEELRGKVAELDVLFGDDQSALELFPFSRDVILAIGREIRGNPRGILRACAWLIDIGYEEQRVFDDVDETMGFLGLQRAQEDAD